MATFVQLLYGPMFIGIVLNIILYGIMVTQTYLYFNMYKDDHRWIKVFVCVLFLCDTVNTALDIAAIYVPLINKFGDFMAVMRASWMFASDSVMTAVIAALVQFFFAWRLKVLTSNKWLVGVIVLCAVTQLLGGIGCTVVLVIDPPFANFRRFRAIGIIWNTAAALADVIITAALVWHLRKHKTGMAATDNVINKIIHLTVPTGLITALFAVLTLVLYFVSSSGYDLIFHMPLAKLYTNSLMSTLNSRHMWLTHICDDSPSLGHSGQRSRANASSSGGRTGRNTRVGASVSASFPEFVRPLSSLVCIDSCGNDPSRSALQVTNPIVIGVESHQITDFGAAKDDRYAPSELYFPEEKIMPDTEAV